MLMMANAFTLGASVFFALSVTFSNLTAAAPLNLLQSGKKSKNEEGQTL